MHIITIKNKGWGSLEIIDGKVKGARLEWCGPSVEIYLIGSHTDCYDLSTSKAMEWAIGKGVRPSQLRTQNLHKPIAPKRQKETLL